VETLIRLKTNKRLSNVYQIIIIAGGCGKISDYHYWILREVYSMRLSKNVEIVGKYISLAF
jgi:hypothetical protein